MKGALVDAAARHTIRHELTKTLVVEAAAGTGKTSELVQRIVAVVETGVGKLSSLLSVTFTEKAAGEMKLRLRTELDRARNERSDGVLRARLSTALRELEAAKICTIHAFCADLLRAHPVAANVDPAFEVADAERARVLLRRAFDGFFADIIEHPPEGVARVLARSAVEGSREDPRTALFQAARSLCETRDFPTPFARVPLDRKALIAACFEQLEGLSVYVAAEHDSRDPLVGVLLKLSRRVRSVRASNADVHEALLRQVLRERGLWERHGRSGRALSGAPRSEVIARLLELRGVLQAALDALNADLAACLSRELRPVTYRYERLKAEQGVLDFFDLLFCACKLLQEHTQVRAELAEQITHVFVDEFQDTDPIQAEILLLLSAASADESDPYRAQVRPGKLFVVGDPKQSIYRFRRADVTLYERIKTHLLAQGAELIQLSTSFRALPALQSLVNATFAPLMGGDALRGQTSYVPLSAYREARTDQPALVALPVPAPYGALGKATKKAVNESLPDAVAAWLFWLLGESGYRVHEHGQPVPVAARHVCLLFRRFRGFDGDVTRPYVRALEARRLPHVLSGGRAFYAREEVMALLAALKAIEWPDDPLFVYALLRGPFVGFTDDQLLAFQHKVGTLSPFREHALYALTPLECEIASVLTLLRSLHRQRNRVPIASTLSRLLSELRAHAGIAIWPTGEQALGNVYKLLGLSRSYERKKGAPSFRGFIAWLDQNAEESGAADATVVEEESDGVRIMTVHAAKGLEFPVVVLCDPTAAGRPEYASRFIDVDNKLWAQPLCEAEPHELTKQRDQVREHDEAEYTRLLYVATTRARELLVVPVCGDGSVEGWLSPLHKALFPAREHWRKPLAPPPYLPRFGPDSVVSWPINMNRVPEDAVQPGEHVPQQGEHRVVFWDPHCLDLSRRTQGGLLQEELLRADAEGSAEELGRARYLAFCAARAAERSAGEQPSLRVRTVTELSHEASLAAPVEVTVLDSGAERATRPRGKLYGTLMHALLQHCSLRASLAELNVLGRHLARTLGASEHERTSAVQDVARALTHPLFVRALLAEERGELYRETPISAPDADGQWLEGVVDLLFRESSVAGSSLVLVDYKTDVQLLDLEPYTRQLARYAEALERAFSEPVTCVLLRI